MKLNRFFQLTSTILLAAFLSACAKEENSGPKTDHELAVHFIENGHYSSAIDITRDILKKNPKDRKARVLMASAYTGRAGIFMRNYTDVAMSLIESGNESKRIFDERGVTVFMRIRERAGRQSEKNLADSLEKAYRAIWQAGDIIRAFEKLPRLNTYAQSEDAQTAIEILSADSELHGGPLLFRGLIRLAVFRYNLENHYDLLKIKNCRLDLSSLVSQLERMQLELDLILRDFSKGTQDIERRAQIQKTNTEMNLMFKEALDWLRSIGATGEVDVTPLVTASGGQCK